MSGPLATFHGRQDGITIPTIWVAFALSLILHALALWGWLPKVWMLPFEDSRQGKPAGSLSVRLAPPQSAAAPPPAPAILAQPAPAHGASRPKGAQRPQSAPRVLALEHPSPAAEAPRPPDNGDFASYVEAHRHAREAVPVPAPSPPVETEQERHNRVVAESLGLNRTPSFGAERVGGGIFQVERVGYDDAEFFFYGWNKDIRRNSRQMIEVRRGSNPSMQIAIVRKMIEIIREHASDDFVWESPRLGRDITLSARAADNAGLEDFMMREFFPDSPRK